MLLDNWFQHFLFLETKVIYYLQPSSYYVEKLLQAVSSLSDPNNAVLHFYPCVAAFCAPDSTFHLDLMLIGSLLIWTSALLKWMFMGDRPFWWVKEVAQFYPNAPALHQTRNTCVANPGNPSAHVMLSAGILFIILNVISSRNHQCSPSSKCSTKRWYSCRWKIGMWSLYIMLLTVVMFSRVYNATHFPHQCLLGAILGGLIAKTIHSKWNSEWQKKQSSFKILSYSLLPVIVAFGSYWIQKAYGIDPQRSVRLAFKWCFSPHDISVNTTPVYSLSCSCGCLFGLGIALILQRATVRLLTYKQKTPIDLSITFQSLFNKSSKVFHLAKSVGVLMSAYSLIQLQKQIPTESVIAFYLQHFAINFAAPILYLFLIPMALRIVSKKFKLKRN